MSKLKAFLGIVFLNCSLFESLNISFQVGVLEDLLEQLDNPSVVHQFEDLDRFVLFCFTFIHLLTRTVKPSCSRNVLFGGEWQRETKPEINYFKCYLKKT